MTKLNLCTASIFHHIIINDECIHYIGLWDVNEINIHLIWLLWHYFLQNCLFFFQEEATHLQFRCFLIILWFVFYSIPFALGQGEFYVNLKSLNTLRGGDLVPEVDAEYVCIGSMQVWKLYFFPRFIVYNFFIFCSFMDLGLGS